jgi:hypothetical protein
MTDPCGTSRRHLCSVFPKIESQAYQDMRHDQLERQNENQDSKLYNWLSPSNWLVESEIEALLLEKQETSLEWAARLPELQAWRASKPGYTG